MSCRKKRKCVISRKEWEFIKNYVKYGTGIYFSMTGIFWLIIRNSKEPSNKKLNIANGASSIAHLLSGLSMVYFARTDAADWRFRIKRSVRKKFSSKVFKIDDDRKRILELFRTSEEDVDLASIRLGYSTASFSFLTTIAHLILLILSKAGIYEKWMIQKKNPMRWFEYFVTSGIMVTNIAGLVGYENIWDLLNIFTLTAVTNLFGYAIETSPKNVDKTVLMIAGFIAFLVPWLMIGIKFNSSFSWLNSDDVQYAIFNKKDSVRFGNRTIKKGEFKPPDFVKLVVPIMASIYLIFPAIQTAQIISPSKYKNGELAFILASLTSKIILNYLVFSGARRDNETPRDCETITCDEIDEFKDMMKKSLNKTRGNEKKCRFYSGI